MSLFSHADLPVPVAPCVLDFWKTLGAAPSGPLPLAIARVLVDRPALVGSIHDAGDAEHYLREAISRLEQQGPDGIQDRGPLVMSLIALLMADGRLEEAEALCRQTMELRRDGATSKDDTSAKRQLVEVLQRRGRFAEAHQLELELETELLLERRDTSSSLHLRGMALDALNARRYAEAERYYRVMLERGFEVPSTRCHLARVLIITGRYAEAEAEVERGMTERGTTNRYTVGRLLCLRAIMAALNGRDPAAAGLSELKGLVGDPAIRMDWTMGAVLEAIRTTITPEHHALLSAVIAGLCNEEGYRRLGALPAWHAIPTLPASAQPSAPADGEVPF